MITIFITTHHMRFSVLLLGLSNQYSVSSFCPRLFKNSAYYFGSSHKSYRLMSSIQQNHDPTGKTPTPYDATFCKAAEGHEWYGPYHDKEYGFPVRGDDDLLFLRLLLEINQAGLSWLTILKKKEGFKSAYPSIATVAEFTDEDFERLRQDSSIIRNKLKIKAAIYNAKAIQEMQKTHGSFELWLEHHHPLNKSEWVKLFKKHFKFTGGEITREFLVSLGYLPGAHHHSCRIYEQIKDAPWQLVNNDDIDWDL